MTKVKICGLTNSQDAIKAESMGADYVGFVFFEKSPRVIDLTAAKAIVSQLKGRAKKVGLFFDQEIEIVCEYIAALGLDFVQLHGNEDPEYIAGIRDAVGQKRKLEVIKSFKVGSNFDFKDVEDYDLADFYLFDTYVEGFAGGTGKAFDWGMLTGKMFDKPFFLAGGLNPNNVKKAIQLARPYAVDVASGVEISPGKKDHRLMKEFIDAAK